MPMKAKKHGKNGKSKDGSRHAEKVTVRHVSSEAMRGVAAIFLVAIAGFLILAEVGGAAPAGPLIFSWLSALLGVGYLLLPLSLILLAVLIFRSFERHFG